MRMCEKGLDGIPSELLGPGSPVSIAKRYSSVTYFIYAQCNFEPKKNTKFPCLITDANLFQKSRSSAARRMA